MKTPPLFLMAGAVSRTTWVAVTELPTEDRVKAYSYFCEIHNGKVYPISVDCARKVLRDDIVRLYDDLVFEHCIYHPDNSIAA